MGGRILGMCYAQGSVCLARPRIPFSVLHKSRHGQGLFSNVNTQKVENRNRSSRPSSVQGP